MKFNRFFFYITYFYYRFISLIFEVKNNKRKIYYFSLIFFIFQITKGKLFRNYYYNIDLVETKFGIFLPRKYTSDLFICLPYFERQDINHLFRILSAALNEGKKILFLDIGDSFGYYTIIFGRYFKESNLNIISFEPVEHNYKCLVRNIRLNKLYELINIKIFLYNIGLFDKDCEEIISIDLKKPSSSSLIFDNNNNNYEETVTLKRFDSLNVKIDKYDLIVIKLDTEGSEVKILKGMENSIKGKELVLLIEDFLDIRVVNYLNNNNFKFLKKITPYNSWWIKK